MKTYLILINIAALIFVPFALNVVYIYLTGKGIPLFDPAIEMTVGIYILFPIIAIVNFKYGKTLILKIAGCFYLILWVSTIVRLIHDMFYL